MAPVAVYLQARINIADLIALLVALIPTTIGALLSAIGIAGIDRTFRFNVLAMSGKAVEAAGDVHTLLLDKTGTITMGNRQATEFIPLVGLHAPTIWSKRRISRRISTRRRKDARSSRLRLKSSVPSASSLPDGARRLDFSAETRMSGARSAGRAGDPQRGDQLPSCVTWPRRSAAPAPPDLQAGRRQSGQEGAPRRWPLPSTARSWALIALSDVPKPGIRERIAQLRDMGIRTVMVTGDNPVTARRSPHKRAWTISWPRQSPRKSYV